MADNIDQYLQDIGIDIEDDSADTLGEDTLLPPLHPSQSAAREDDTAKDNIVEANIGVGSQEAAHLTAAAVAGTTAEDHYLGARCESFLVGLLGYIDPGYDVKVVAVDAAAGEVAVAVDGGRAGPLIGRNGRTLAALEYLTNTIVNRHINPSQKDGIAVTNTAHDDDDGAHTSDAKDTNAAGAKIQPAEIKRAPRIRVNIDVSDYKKRRDERLIGLAQSTAEKVRRTGIAVELEPMTPAERRIVHMEIAAQSGVFSESTGQGEDRRLAIKPDMQ